MLFNYEYKFEIFWNINNFLLEEQHSTNSNQIKYATLELTTSFITISQVLSLPIFVIPLLI